MPTILKIAVPVPLPKIFDYLPPAGSDASHYMPGIRVEVPFGRSRKVGILLETTNTTDCDPEQLRASIGLLDAIPLLDAQHLNFLSWISRYYHYPIGETLATGLTANLRKGLAPSSGQARQRALNATDTTPPESLQRSPRQAELLQLIQNTEYGLTPDVLCGLPFDWRPAAKGLIRKGLAEWRELSRAVPVNPNPSKPLTLNPEQAAAVTAVQDALGQFQVFLLEGVTGSGKTEVYLQLAQEVLARHQQVLILLPEISLTPQLERRFRTRLAGRVAVFHSGLADGQRDEAWMQAREGIADVLLGARSAALIPLQKLGLIIMDEEHDASYKQQDGLRFSARDVAIVRGRQLNIPVLLGSATPSMESYWNVEQGRYQHLRLTQRAGGAAAPGFRRLDIRGQPLREGLSIPLIRLLSDNLSKGEQSLLFLNRRGFAPTCICHACGWVAECNHCDANMVIHAGEQQLRCHHCGYQQALTPACPSCHSHDLKPLGLGTERMEQTLADIFPTARVARIDRDSTRRKGSLERLLGETLEGNIDILVGTQMLAKGHHFPNVTLVAIVDVDASLYSTDFRSAERTAQLITQVAGRAGRESKPGLVVLQTRHPDHPLLLELTRGGYSGFMQTAIRERREAGLPPFSFQAMFRAEARDIELPTRFLGQIAEWATAMNLPNLWILGPVPAPLARRADRHRFQLLLQSTRRSDLHILARHLMPSITAWPESRKVHWSLDMDPVDLY